MTTHAWIKHGFPNHWAAGPLIKELHEKIVKNVDAAYPSPSINLVVDTTWLSNSASSLPHLLQTYRDIGHIDNLFLCALPDNINLDFPYPSTLELKTIQIGNVNGNDLRYHFDFWAVSVNRSFKKYNVDDVLLRTDSPIKFLAYQNKPHDHRQYFTHLLINDNLTEHGILTLNNVMGGKSVPFKFDNLRVFSVEETIDVGNRMIGDDNLTKEVPYDLGELGIWNRCFLNVVCETISNNSTCNNFITEKTYKPIIGMRPFVINGHSNFYNLLANRGFYTFEEYWPYADFRNCVTYQDTCNQIVNVVHQLAKMSNEDVLSMYQDMMPKLEHNRSRFFEYAMEQEAKINNLFG